MKNIGQVIIYKNHEGINEITVKLHNDTVWLNQKQMSELFDKDSDTVGLHIKNIYEEKELDQNSTSEEYSVVQKEGNRKVTRRIKFYNLDMIISVGYRVNSKRGTQFRIWATKVLKEHLVKGYTANQKRLEELSQNIEIVQRAIDQTKIRSESNEELLNIILKYTKSWILLNKYDKGDLDTKDIETKQTNELDYEHAKNAINSLKEALIQKDEASELFGNESNSSLKGILNSINQTFDGKDLYPSLEEKAAHLLYFIIKDHPFSDGNKRIGAMLFIIYLSINNFLYKQDGERKINDNALVSLALLIAQSNPKEKDSMIALVMNLLVG